MCSSDLQRLLKQLTAIAETFSLPDFELGARAMSVKLTVGEAERGVRELESHIAESIRSNSVVRDQLEAAQEKNNHTKAQLLRENEQLRASFETYKRQSTAKLENLKSNLKCTRNELRSLRESSKPSAQNAPVKLRRKRIFLFPAPGGLNASEGRKFAGVLRIATKSGQDGKNQSGKLAQTASRQTIRQTATPPNSPSTKTPSSN